MEKTDGAIQVDLWYASASELYNSNIEFEDYAQMQQIFGDKVNFIPRTMTSECTGCSA